MANTNRTFSVVCTDQMEAELLPAIERLQAKGIKISTRQRLGLNGLAKAVLCHFLEQSPDVQLEIAKSGAASFRSKFDSSSSAG